MVAKSAARLCWALNSDDKRVALTVGWLVEMTGHWMAVSKADKMAE